jgi:hypothetical protein
MFQILYLANQIDLADLIWNQAPTNLKKFYPIIKWNLFLTTDNLKISILKAICLKRLNMVSQRKSIRSF